MGIASFGAGIVRFTQAHKPEICIIGGTAGIIAGGAMGVKATLKVDKVLDEAKTKLETDASPKTYFNIGLDFAKLYGPAVIVTGMGVSGVFYGTNIFQKRNLALIGACALLEDKVDRYAHHIKELAGGEDGFRLRHDIEKREVEFVETDEKGKEKKVKKEVEVFTNTENNRPSDTAKFFCESSYYWTKDPEQNLIFLKEVEAEVNAIYDKKGYMKLNDVYERLDIPKTELGQHLGWVKGYGDDFIDFGIYNGYREGNERFVNGLEPVVLLDFNHDGYIWDKIGASIYPETSF